MPCTDGRAGIWISWAQEDGLKRSWVLHGFSELIKYEEPGKVSMKEEEKTLNIWSSRESRTIKMESLTISKGKRRTVWWGTFWNMPMLSGRNTGRPAQRFWIREIRDGWREGRLVWYPPMGTIFWIKWSGSQRWWEASRDWKKVSRKLLRRRVLITEVDEKKGRRPEEGMENDQNKAEEERRMKAMKERERQRIWDPAWGNRMRIQILGNSYLMVNWMNGRWKINYQEFRMEIHKTRNILHKMDLRLMADHLDVFQRNQEADRLTFVAREKGDTWNPYVKGEGEKIEAVGSFFDGGVSSVRDSSTKNKVGSAFCHSSGRKNWRRC